MAGKQLPPVPPAKYLTFDVMRGFERRWTALGLSDEDLLLLQGQIMLDPTHIP